MSKSRFLPWETSEIKPTVDEQFFQWIPGKDPDFAEGIMFVFVPPAGGSIQAHGSIYNAEEPARKYSEIGEQSTRSEERDELVDKPFRHFKVSASAAGGVVRVYSDGRFQQVDAP